MQLFNTRRPGSSPRALLVAAATLLPALQSYAQPSKPAAATHGEDDGYYRADKGQPRTDRASAAPERQKAHAGQVDPLEQVVNFDWERNLQRDQLKMGVGRLPPDPMLLPKLVIPPTVQAYHRAMMRAADPTNKFANPEAHAELTGIPRFQFGWFYGVRASAIPGSSSLMQLLPSSNQALGWMASTVSVQAGQDYYLGKGGRRVGADAFHSFQTAIGGHSSSILRGEVLSISPKLWGLPIPGVRLLLAKRNGTPGATLNGVSVGIEGILALELSRLHTHPRLGVKAALGIPWFVSPIIGGNVFWYPKSTESLDRMLGWSDRLAERVTSHEGGSVQTAGHLVSATGQFLRGLGKKLTEKIVASHTYRASLQLKSHDNRSKRHAANQNASPRQGFLSRLLAFRTRSPGGERRTRSRTPRQPY